MGEELHPPIIFEGRDGLEQFCGEGIVVAIAFICVVKGQLEKTLLFGSERCRVQQQAGGQYYEEESGHAFHRSVVLHFFSTIFSLLS